ncbi:MAG: ribosomal RNA small subunit methyltransferase A [Candidatus Eisenbacteria sp.]|nr:ribosomal RNA small subunit methyltransferase A [Candidatus Eisenbacteria bacterium]
MSVPVGTKQWLRAAGIRPRKAWGQNFLINARVAERIVAAWPLDTGTAVLEIGAGAGALTLPLLARGVPVLAVERDPRLATLLERRAAAECPGAPLRVQVADIRELAPGAELAGGVAAGGEISHWGLVGNLPYAVTTPIFEWVLKFRRHFAWAAFMVQREFAARLLAPVGSADYGSLTLWVRFRYRVTKQLAVGQGNFWPIPKVDSIVVRLDPLTAPPVEVSNEARFERIVRAAFAHRRKVIAGSLAHSLRLPRATVDRALEEAGIDSRKRAQECELDEFAALSRVLEPLLAAAAPSRGLRNPH